MSLSLKELESSQNIAELLDGEQLSKIGSQVLRGYELDEDSRSEWKDIIQKAMDIAKQTVEVKNHPFAGSSNIKYPLITKGAIDFASRTYPEIIRNDKIVKVAVIGRDPGDEKAKRADRVSKHMSYQLMYESKSWEESLDRLLHVLPILGTVFKKTYQNTVLGRPASELCYPDKIVVNYRIQSLDDARRITHILSLSLNDVIERVRRGLWLDIDVERFVENVDGDDDAPIEFLEQHCYLDLDEDGYKEPYIVFVHKQSGEVLRIVQRFKKVSKNKKGEVMLIEPEMYFTDFHFIRSPDGGFYSVGLGTLLYPLNAAINTLINQLIDSGTLNNSQGGFLGRGLRLKQGDMKLRLGEWKVLDSAMGTNLAQNIVPLPTKEPSQTLFHLLGLLIEIGKDLVSAQDPMQGKGPTQNVATSTINTMVEQGMKIFNAIHKRLYRALKMEFEKIFLLNQKYLTEDDYQNIIDDPAGSVKDDYNTTGYNICPVADPSTSSALQRMSRAQAVLSMPAVNRYEADKDLLEALEFDEDKINRLRPKPDPNAPPPPEIIKLMAEADKLKAEAQALLISAQVDSAKVSLEGPKLELDQKKQEMADKESQARITKMQGDAGAIQGKLQLAASKDQHKSQVDIAKILHQQHKTDGDLAIKVAEVQLKSKEIDKKPKVGE